MTEITYDKNLMNMKYKTTKGMELICTGRVRKEHNEHYLECQTPYNTKHFFCKRKLKLHGKSRYYNPAKLVGKDLKQRFITVR